MKPITPEEIKHWTPEEVAKVATGLAMACNLICSMFDNMNEPLRAEYEGRYAEIAKVCEDVIA